MTERKRAAWFRWCCWIVGGALVVAAVSFAVFKLIVPPAGDDPKARLDAIRTAWMVTGGLVVMAGPAVWDRWNQRKALQLQQESKELQRKTLELQREIHELQVKKDRFDRVEARQRQVNDQFDQAVAKLGAESVAAKVAGVTALDRLGCEHPDLREEIVEVWCTLLRTRVTEPAGRDDVRALVQRVLLDHLRVPYDGAPTLAPGEEHTAYWQLRQVNLTGADLIDADFTDCLLPNFQARLARFYGVTRFTKARFTGPVTFASAQCKGFIDFTAAFFAEECVMDAITVEGGADLTRAVFQGPFECSSATFTGPVTFRHVRFLHTARFVKSSFAGTAEFDDSKWVFRAEFTLAIFEDYAGFRGAVFADRAVFGRATFGAAVSFESAQFGRNAIFIGVICCSSASFNDAHFDEDVAFDDTQFADTAGFRRVRFKDGLTCCGVRFDALAAFNEATFTGRVDFSSTVLGADAVLDCTGATATVGVFVPSDRIWPAGWTALDEVTCLRLVPIPDPRADRAAARQAPTSRTT